MVCIKISVTTYIIAVSFKKWWPMPDLPSQFETQTNKVFCNYCPGYCCYKLEGSILFVTAADINRLARHFNISDGQVRKDFIHNRNTFKTREDGSCIFLSNGILNKRCSIHLARPQQCIDFPYDTVCPYLQNDNLMRQIAPKFEKSLKHNQDENNT